MILVFALLSCGKLDVNNKKILNTRRHESQMLRVAELPSSHLQTVPFLQFVAECVFQKLLGKNGNLLIPCTV